MPHKFRIFYDVKQNKIYACVQNTMSLKKILRTLAEVYKSHCKLIAHAIKQVGLEMEGLGEGGAQISVMLQYSSNYVR